MKSICPLYCLFLLFSQSVFSNDSLIAQELRKLESSRILKQYALITSFNYLGNEKKFLVIWLLKPPTEKIGLIMVEINASQEILKQVEDQIRSTLIFELTNEQLQILRDLLANVSYLNWIGIDHPDYQRKGLSYPLICSAMNILKKIFKKDYVVLDDVSQIPSYYEKLGFRDLGLVQGKQRKYAALSQVIMSNKCLEVLSP